MSTVKSFSVGNGDLFYINHNSDNFSIIDCCYKDEISMDEDFEEIKHLATQKGIVRFISTHPDEDHIHGLKTLDEKINIVNFYCVENQATKKDETENFKKYCELRDSSKAYYVSKGCTRKWMNKSDTVRTSAGINFLWPVTNNKEYLDALDKAKLGEEYNNLSPIFTYSVENGARFMWMGDMENDFRENIKDNIKWPKVDILFAPHHGRESGRVSRDILNYLEPQIVVIGKAPSKHLDYYEGYNTIKQNSAGDIVFDCSDNYIHIYVEKEDYPYPIDNLERLSNRSRSGYCYLGSLKTHEG